ncbi:MAG: GNAT family N-acetyltransferase [Clostridiales bacterium]|nr:GNAT family N-acetyltransferase [Clostridiales bacterium]
MKERLIKLYKKCFPEDGQAVAKYMFDTILSPENALIEYDGDIIISAVYLVDKTLYYKNSVVCMPYIVALGTDPDYRYKGYSKKLIIRCLEKLYKENLPFVALYPFNHAFYQKFGFFIASFDYKLSGKKVKCSIEDIKQIYQKFCSPLDYYIVRDDSFYDFVLGMLNLEQRSFCKVIDNDNLVGYTNGEESLPAEYKLAKEPGVMVRIVDAKAALSISNLTFDKKIMIKDELIKENNFCCKVDGGKVIKTCDYDVAIDIAHLGEIIFGKKTIDGKNVNTLNGYLADKY